MRQQAIEHAFYKRNQYINHSVDTQGMMHDLECVKDRV